MDRGRQSTKYLKSCVSDTGAKQLLVTDVTNIFPHINCVHVCKKGNMNTKFYFESRPNGTLNMCYSLKTARPEGAPQNQEVMFLKVPL